MDVQILDRFARRGKKLDRQIRRGGPRYLANRLIERRINFSCRLSKGVSATQTGYPVHNPRLIPMAMSGAALPDALYYLRNFQHAIAWVVERNEDLLSAPERQFAADLAALAVPAQALLARLSMRRGELFRRSKIH